MPMEAVSPSPLTPSAIDLRVRQHRAGRHRRHASVHGVEAVRAAHEIGRALRRAADARHLDDALRRDAHLVEGVDDALGDGVVAAAGAQRGLAAAIVEHGQADAVGLGLVEWRGRHLLALLGNDVVGDGARIDGQPVVVAHAAQLRDLVPPGYRASAVEASARRGSGRRRRRACARR